MYKRSNIAEKDMKIWRHDWLITLLHTKNGKMGNVFRITVDNVGDYR